MITPETYIAGNETVQSANAGSKTSKNTNFSLLQLGRLDRTCAGKSLQPRNRHHRILYIFVDLRIFVCDRFRCVSRTYA